MVFCLTTCAACAAPLPPDAPKCVRCRMEETERTARNVFGNSHPLVLQIEEDLRKSRKALADARASSEQLALAALAFVAAVAFLVGRRYLRR